MSKQPYYNEHENWIRLWAVGEARQINKYCRDAKRVLEDAQHITNFILGKPQTEVLALTVVAKEGGEA